MHAFEMYRSPRHRTWILIYIAWLTLSLAPAMVAPPERSFNQGQPEMQQAMDNMVTRPSYIQKRRVPRSPTDGYDMEEINAKTSTLLAEADEILKTLPESKERHWLESFVEKMHEIAKHLEETAQRKPQAENKGSEKRSPVQNGLTKQSPRPTPSAVPEITPLPKAIGMVSKIQKTSPEESKVLKKEAASKPVQLQLALSSKTVDTETDELVAELESLHKELIHRAPSESPKMVNDQAETTTTPPPPPSSSPSSKRNFSPLLKEETEKAKLRAKLIEGIDKFHRLGGVMPKEVIDVLYADNHNIPESVLHRKLNIDEEMRFTVKEKQGLDDVNNEDKAISMANMKHLPPYPAQMYQYMKFNHTFPGRHPNYVQPYSRQNGYYFQNTPPRPQFYQGNPQNFGRMNPQYYQGMSHQPVPMPNVFPQRMGKPYNYYNGRLPPPNYPNYFPRNNYNPYPYVHNWNPQNSTAYFPQMMPPSVAYQANMGTQFSDAMKRDLRDGKIVVLSDSVVRSNFDADKNGKNATQSSTEKPELEYVDKKNETVAEN